MPSRPTDATFAAIVSAIAVIEADPHAPRTKAHLMRLADIAHPTVHRAFKWDIEQGTPFKINERWDTLVGDEPTRRSPSESAKADLEQRFKDARNEISDLRQQLATTRLVAAAAWLRNHSDGGGATPINRRRIDEL